MGKVIYAWWNWIGNHGPAGRLFMQWAFEKAIGAERMKIQRTNLQRKLKVSPHGR